MNVGDDDDAVNKPQRPRHQRHPITQKQSSPSKPCGHRHHLRRRVVDLHCELALSSSLAPLSPSLPLKPSLNPLEEKLPENNVDLSLPPIMIFRGHITISFEVGVGLVGLGGGWVTRGGCWGLSVGVGVEDKGK
ncbi:unnamed protein product [Prunus armeniaca]|uniref:Uncharacterized protein n=1 Tax=Prunus armeniaca TaxID=36596 RepID=A0A6J5XQJ9_PRUAR|nr:unnamed protein product [Prunus armeniaca]